MKKLIIIIVWIVLSITAYGQKFQRETSWRTLKDGYGMSFEREDNSAEISLHFIMGKYAILDTKNFEQSAKTDEKEMVYDASGPQVKLYFTDDKNKVKPVFIVEFHGDFAYLYQGTGDKKFIVKLPRIR